ncbi:MAG: hypothetical protein WBM43_02615 [Flavobacteriaceae bacterium]
MIPKNFTAFFRLVTFALILSGSFIIRSQEKPQKVSYLNWFDQEVGLENTALYDGIIYKETYRTINEKIKFYKSSAWINGTVKYAGQLFTNVPMRYDVFGDQLLIKLNDQLGGGALLLFKDKVSNFTIDGAVFVNISNISEASGRKGFYELLWDKDHMRLLAKHQKNDFLRKDRRSLYYEFVDLKKEYLLEFNGEYSPIGKKKSINVLFPQFKKEIENFYQQNKRLRSRDMDAFMSALVNRIEDLLLQSQPKSQS